MRQPKIVPIDVMQVEINNHLVFTLKSFHGSPKNKHKYQLSYAINLIWNYKTHIRIQGAFMFLIKQEPTAKQWFNFTLNTYQEIEDDNSLDREGRGNHTRNRYKKSYL